MPNSSDILPLCEINFEKSIYSNNFSGRGYLPSVPLIQKDFVTHNHSLTIYDLWGIHGNILIYVFILRLISFLLWISAFCFVHGFDAILSNIYEVHFEVL